MFTPTLRRNRHPFTIQRDPIRVTEADNTLLIDILGAGISLFTEEVSGPSYDNRFIGPVF